MTRPQTPCENTSTRPAKVELWPVSRTFVSKQQNHLISLKNSYDRLSIMLISNVNSRVWMFYFFEVESLT